MAKERKARGEDSVKAKKAAKAKGTRPVASVYKPLQSSITTKTNSHHLV